MSVVILCIHFFGTFCLFFKQNIMFVFITRDDYMLQKIYYIIDVFVWNSI